MKALSLAIAVVLSLGWLPLKARAGDHVFPYTAFGPQVIAHELIGMEWWQWDNHGDSRPGNEPPIKVVVYWKQTLEETRKKFPVNRAKKQDFRYVEYDAAVAHMEKAIADLEEAKLDAKEIRDALKTLRSARKQAAAVDERKAGAPGPSD